MKPTAFARLLLILALLLVQTGGLMHEISHIVVHPSHDHSLPHEKHCNLCAAYAQMGTALGSHAPEFQPIVSRMALTDTVFDAVLAASPFTAFAARAPPLSI